MPFSSMGDLPVRGALVQTYKDGVVGDMVSGNAFIAKETEPENTAIAMQK
jgi:hypothetical protein